jgi:hypothetical protein
MSRPAMRSFTGAFGFSSEFVEALTGAAGAAEEIARRRSASSAPPAPAPGDEDADVEPVTVPILPHE